MSIIIQNNEKKQARISLYHYRLEENGIKKVKQPKEVKMKNKIHKKGFSKINCWDQNPCVMSGFKVSPPSGWDQNRTALKSSLSQWSSHRQETLLAVVESSSGTFWNPASSIWANHDAGSSRSHDTAAKGGEWKKERRNEGKNRRWEEGDRAQALVRTTHADQTPCNITHTHTTSHNFAIRSSLNMQQSQWVNLLASPPSAILSRQTLCFYFYSLPGKMSLIHFG